MRAGAAPPAPILLRGGRGRSFYPPLALPVRCEPGGSVGTVAGWGGPEVQGAVWRWRRSEGRAERGSPPRRALPRPRHGERDAVRRAAGADPGELAAAERQPGAARPRPLLQVSD